MERQPLYVFKNENETGLDKVPPGSIVGVLCTGSIYQLKNKTGITNLTEIKDVKGTNLFVYGLATGRGEENNCIPISVSVPTNIIILYPFPHDNSTYTHTYSNNGGVYGPNPQNLNLVVNPNNQYQTINVNGTVYYTSTSKWITAATAVLYPDGNYIEGEIYDGPKDDLIAGFEGYYIGKTWDKTI